MHFEKNDKKRSYKVVMVESDLPHSFSSAVDAKIENDDSVSFSVYNNPTLYKVLTRTINKYFKDSDSE